MELFTIDDEGLHRGIEINLGMEWLCSVALTPELRARAHEAAEHRGGHALPWATDLRILLGSAAFSAGYSGKKLDASTLEVEQEQAGQALVLVDVHGAPLQDGRDGKVTVSHNGELVTMTRRIVRTRMLILVGVGGWVDVRREGDTSAGGEAPDLPSRMLYRLRAAGGTATEIIPLELWSDRWSRDLVSVPWPAMQGEVRVTA